MQNKDFKKGLKSNNATLKSNKRDPSINDIPEIRFDPHLGRSNLYEIQEVLNTYVKLNLPSLKDCIATRKLKYVERPVLPTDSKIDSTNNINTTNNINVGNNDTTNVTNTNIIDANNTSNSQQQIAEDSLANENISEIDDENYGAKESYDPDDENDSEDEDEMAHFPQQIDDLLNTSIPYEIRLRMYERRMGEYERNKHEQDNHLSALHTIIHDLIPTDLLAKIKLNKEYKLALKKLDGFILWNVVFDEFQFKENQLSMVQQRIIAGRNFTNFRQNRIDLHTYYKIFKQNLKTMKQVGCHLPSTEEVIQYFIDGLDDNKFNNFKAFVRNSKHTNTTLPDNLEGIYYFALDFSSNNRTNNYNDSNQNSYNSNVYNTNIKQFKKNNKIKSNYNNIKNNNNSGDNDVNNDRKNSGNDNQINNNFSTTNQSQVIKCTFCNKKGHLIDDCRWKKKLQKLNNTDSSNNNNSTKINQNSSNNNNNNNSNNKNSSSQFYFEANEINIDEQNSDMVVFSSQKHDDIDDNLIVLDTGAQTSIFNNESMLHDINVSNIYLKIHGINKNSKPIQTNKFGYLKGLEDVKIYISHEIKRNILSYSQVNNHYNIKWNSKKNSFTINGNNVNYNFKMENKLYIQQMDTDSNVLVTTVKQNLFKFTNSEIKQAELVKNIQQKLSYEPDASLIQAIKKGVIVNLPITTRDVVNKNKIFGIDIERLKGGTVKRKSNVYKDIEVEKEEEKQQQLLIDLMYINKDTYFISLSDPMDLVMIKFINFGDIPNSKSKETLNETIIEHITSYKSQGFYINTVKSDNEPAMKALTTTINSFGAVHNTGGVGSNGLAKLDRKIRMIKERVRGLLSGLPYSWPSVILKWPVEYAVRTINMLPHSFQPFESRSPFEKYTGRKVDYKRDLRIGFGQYAQIHHASTNNSMLERTSGGICLKPTSNANGSVYFLQLSTGRPVLVDHWTEIPTPDTVIKYMNDQAAEIKNKIITKDPTFKYHGKIIESEEGEEDKNLIKIPTKHDEYRMVMNLPPPNYVNGSENIKYDLNNYGRVVIKNKNFIDSEDDDESIDNIADGNCEEIITSDNLTPHETQLTDQIINNNQLSTTTLSVDPLSNNNIINNNNNDNTENNSHDENNNNININDDEIIINNNNNINDINNNNNNNNRTESIQTRSGRKIIKNKKYFNTDINFITIEGDGDKELIELSIIEELKQMEEKQVFIPVNPNKINSTPIPCHMFVKSKVDSDGNFIKWKARIVAGGNKQNKHEILDVSSPTINRQKLMLICSIAAQQSKEVATIDIKGAFLNANMNDIVFMKLDRQLTNLMISINPEYRKYVNENNQLIVQLRKALYGCVQSSRLWYLELSNFIMSLGFNKSIHDDCVFFKIEDDGTYTHMCVYVDDILITSSNIKYIKYIEQSLKLKFSEISFNYGKLHQYLGMQLDFTNNGELIITMKNKINQLLEEYNIKNTATTPSTNNLFKNNQDKELLDKQDQDIIRSGVAKLLYISINMRYDISLPVNYLCSRVEKYNEDDIYKFIRILEYLNNTKDLYLKLKIGNINSLNVYIDASYAIREVDRRSQTGMVIKLGSATIMVRSSSQKIVTKSSTESELVAVADCISFIVDINNFLKEIGFEVTNNVIFQDNISTINLINNKKPTSQRTLHIDAKYFFIRERKLINNLIIRHLHTDKMIADMLTKPIQGKKFNNLKNQIMNIN